MHFNFNEINLDVPIHMVPSGPEVINLFSFSTQLSMKFILLINVKLLNVGILTFLSRINYWLWSFKPELSIDYGYFDISKHLKIHAQLS